MLRMIADEHPIVHWLMTIGRFHPIAQKQKTDLNIRPGLVRRGSRDVKTKAGRKSGCEIDRKVGQGGRQQPGG